MSSDPIYLSLEPEGAYGDDSSLKSLSLGQIIPRIILERGSFASITKESLEEEIAYEELLSRTSADPDDKDNSVADDETQTTEEKKEDDNVQVDKDNDKNNDVNDNNEPAEILDVTKPEVPLAPTMSAKDFEQARTDLVQLIRTAQNETALSLDFVSLLLSCLRPAAGTTSMSPHLKQHVAVGSLGADASWVQPPEEDPVVGAGWKVQSLGEASKQLKNAALRLKGEVFKEQKYWNAVLTTVVNNGEVMFKIRRGDARGLGIKYGYGDSGSEYRDKGLAMVRRKPDGGVAFRFDRIKPRKAVRVVLYDISSGEKVAIGASIPTNLLTEDCVDSEIKNARMILFEEELFFEMVQEARLLSSYKIVVNDNTISIYLFDEILEIEYSDLNSTHFVEGLPQLKADLICNALHILLSYSHKRRLEKRRSVPAPLTKNPPSQPQLFILRPLIAHIQHSKIVKRTTRLLDMILEDYKNIKMTFESYKDTASSSASSSYLGHLLYPPVSKYKLELENGTIIVITASSPLQSSHVPLYDVKALSKDGTLSKTGLYELSDLENWVNWILKIRQM